MPSDDGAQPDLNATLRHADCCGIRSLDPHKRLQSGDTQFMNNLYDRLLRIDRLEDGTVGPGPWLATSFNVADDAMSREFELRDDVLFQDGTPFKAQAVQANIERAKTLPDSTVTSVLANVDSVEVIDDTHVVFHVATPDPALPYKMASDSAGLMISPAAFDTDLESHPVSSGPYTLVSAEAGGDVVLERWDDYWNQDYAGLVKRAIISTVPDGNARLYGIRTGTFDIGYAFPPQDIEAVRLADEEGYQFIRSGVGSLNSLQLNSALPPFDDLRVRQAVAMAIDRQALAAALGETGLFDPLYQAFPEGMPGHLDELDAETYDPDAARALIQEAGAEGAHVQFLQLQVAPWDTMGLVVQQALNDIGLDVELIPVAGADWRSRWNLADAHGRAAVQLGTGVPSLIVDETYLGGDNVAEPPAELAELAEQAKALTGDAQTAAYEDINRWLADNPVQVPLIVSRTPFLAVPGFIGAENWALRQLDLRGVGLSQ